MAEWLNSQCFRQVVVTSLYTRGCIPIYPIIDISSLKIVCNYCEHLMTGSIIAPNDILIVLWSVKSWFFICTRYFSVKWWSSTIRILIGENLYIWVYSDITIRALCFVHLNLPCNSVISIIKSIIIEGWNENKKNWYNPIQLQIRVKILSTTSVLNFQQYFER